MLVITSSNFGISPNIIADKLYDPSFAAPVYAHFIQGDKGEHKPIWSR